VYPCACRHTRRAPAGFCCMCRAEITRRWIFPCVVFVHGCGGQARNLARASPTSSEWSALHAAALIVGVAVLTLLVPFRLTALEAGRPCMRACLICENANPKDGVIGRLIRSLLQQPQHALARCPYVRGCRFEMMVNKRTWLRRHRPVAERRARERIQQKWAELVDELAMEGKRRWLNQGPLSKRGHLASCMHGARVHPSLLSQSYPRSLRVPTSSWLLRLKRFDFSSSFLHAHLSSFYWTD
jgi:hypothetical protein